MKRTRPVANAPCKDQTAESVKEWLRANVRVGTVVAIRETQFGMLMYQRAAVVRIGRGRFEVSRQSRDGSSVAAGETFYYSGKNCWEPKGQTRLVVPTDAVLQACDICERVNGPLPDRPWSHTYNF